MWTMDKRKLTVGSIVLAVLLFVGVNIFAATVVKSVRLDLTADKLFTLSDGTRKVLQAIDEPVTLRLYFSRALADQSSAQGVYYQRVRDLLEHYVRIADGKLKLEFFDPEPYSVLEDEAVKVGLYGVPMTAAGDRGYFGLAASNSTDDREIVSLFDRRREEFLEYDLTRLIYKLANPKKPVVGLVESVMMYGDQMRRQGPWAILDQIGQFFEVRSLGNDFASVDADVDVLMLVHPNALSDDTLYAVDQFVMRGGRLMAFLDPHAEAMLFTQRASIPGISASDLNPLLSAWGVSFDKEKFVGDANTAVRVAARSGGRDVTTRYLAWLALGEGNLSKDDVVSGQLDHVIMAATGAFFPMPGATTTFTPLMTSSDNAALMAAEPIRYGPDPVKLMESFVSDKQRYVVAARVHGPAASAFPDGPPSLKNLAATAADPTSPEDAARKADEEKKRQAAKAAHIAQSKVPVNLVLVGDVDMLMDRFWVQQQDVRGQQIAVPTSSNADFVVNALDNLTGSSDLISLRSRSQSSRPFEVLQEIQANAELRYRKQEQALVEQLQETERKLVGLQAGSGSDGGQILSDKQRQAIDEFRAQMLSIRQQLRDVQHDLRREIEDLNTRLKIVNIWAMPVLVSIVALVIAMVRRNRHRRHSAHG